MSVVQLFVICSVDLLYDGVRRVSFLNFLEVLPIARGYTNTRQFAQIQEVTEFCQFVITILVLKILDFNLIQDCMIDAKLVSVSILDR